MNYALIRENDIANGPGVRTSLFVSGCRHHCKGCFNEEAWDFNYGKEFTEEDIERIINEFEYPLERHRLNPVALFSSCYGLTEKIIRGDGKVL
mgnify:CR=1 FL=1